MREAYIQVSFRLTADEAELLDSWAKRLKQSKSRLAKDLTFLTLQTLEDTERALREKGVADGKE